MTVGPLNAHLIAYAKGQGPIRSLRLHGHTLRNEGKAVEGRKIVGYGRGRCSCGTDSPVESADAARNRWHRCHLVDVLYGRWTG